MPIQDNLAPPGDRGLLRKNIRKKVVEILKGKTDVGNRVFPNASTVIDEALLPVILIYPRSESASKYATAPRELERDLDLAIEIIAKGPETDETGIAPEDQDPSKKSLEDILDDIAEQIECELSRDDTLQNTVDDSILTNIEFEFEGSGGLPIGSARLTYAVTYFTMSPRSVDKQGGLADFKTAEVEHNIGDDPNTREAKDSVAIPQT